jgi:L-threonylcarbamoyladenylate synthase
LIRALGRPIAAPSANRSTGISPTVAQHVLKDLNGKIDLILDGGQTTLGLESTVLDLAGDRPQVLRPGGVTREQIAEVLGEPVDEPTPQAGPARSPGQMEVHYSPRTPTFRAQRHNDSAYGGPLGGMRYWALITFGEEAEAKPYSDVTNGPTIHVRLVDPIEAARSLYAVLHNCDDHGLELILIVPPPDGPEWQAVRDRVNRAALQIP